jgi:hypothetical protein
VTRLTAGTEALQCKEQASEQKDRCVCVCVCVLGGGGCGVKEASNFV